MLVVSPGARQCGKDINDKRFGLSGDENRDDRSAGLERKDRRADRGERIPSKKP
jgi:hypothetical protein